MTSFLPRTIGKYRNRGVLLDTNLLLLLFVGSVEPTLVEDFKRTKNHGFSKSDFDLVNNLAGRFARIITTPHILTETTNFLNQLSESNRHAALSRLASCVQGFKERRQESKRLVRSPDYLEFGLTDSAILDLPPNRYLVLSVDAALVIALQKRGVEAFNFNHIRQLSWQT